MKLSDDDLLRLCQTERQASRGFDHDSVLTTSRIRALEYSKGEMHDVPALENRSRAVSTDVADAIETLLPDLVEMFTTGEDDFAFMPTSAEDEAQAQQETDYVNQVVFKDNDGFLTLTTMLKDALQSKTGVVKWAWQEPAKATEEFEERTVLQAVADMQRGELSDLKGEQNPETGEMQFSYTITKQQPGKVIVDVYPPEDFTVAADTVTLRDTTYCAARTRPRVQDLIASGMKRALVEDLPPYGQASEEGINYARDTASEHNMGVDGSSSGERYALRTVEIVEHYLRVDADGDGQPEIHRIVTGGDETVMLDHEVVERIQFAAAKPFLVTHRFYGESLADKLLELQKIKTAISRIALDSAYFAQNQRMEVDMSGAHPETMNDLLDNTPGMPVRVKRAGTVQPLQGAPLGFDPFQALEYFSTVAEQRTGIVRNAQGLNPDTLHDTATGQQALMTMAQKRTRLIARMLAETGLKDLFLGVHALLRRHATQASSARIKGQWVNVDPSQWPERNDMTVEIGMGASGKEMQQADLVRIAPLIHEIIQQQGGTSGPYITQDNFYAYLQMAAKALTLRGAERLFSDPKTAPPPPPAQPPLEQVKMQGEQQLAQAKAAREHEALGVKLLMEHHKEVAAQTREALKLKAEEEDRQRKYLLEVAKLEQQRDLAILDLNAKYQTTIDAAQVRAAAEAGRVMADLHMDATGHDHESRLQEREHEHIERVAQQAPEAAADPNPALADADD